MNNANSQMLNLANSDDPRAAEDLLPLVYQELRKLAGARMAAEQPGQTLQATALVHEAYLRILGPEGPDGPQWNGRAHFFGAAAEAMRRILIDRARAKRAEKRGGGVRPAIGLSLDAIAVSLDNVPAELLDLDDAMNALAQEEPKKAELVRLRFYAGLTLEQAGRVLGLSPATADRHWVYARAWLFARLSGEPKKP
jgi:RNA polymerase sigma factor (TIGR02999 family)